MTQRILPSQIKKNNRQQIYHYIYRTGRVSQQDIAIALNLSRPTVATNLAALEADGLILNSGPIETEQMGRRAVGYVAAPDFRIALGAELMSTKARIIAVNLYGQSLAIRELPLRYVNNEDYYRTLCAEIRRFIGLLRVPIERILGIGITMQGLVSPDGRRILYGSILGCTGLSIEAFEKWLDIPCTFIRGSHGAALSELWVSPEMTNAIYLSLGLHMEGARIYGGNILKGKHGHTATFEHMQARPRGLRCYCGKRGCWDTLCSMKALLGDGDPDTFFALARKPDTEPARRWQAYLKNLAQLIEELHLVNDVDIVLGGHLAPYFTAADIQALYREIHQLCPYDDVDDFIHISKMPSNNIAVGASLPYIRQFLDDIDDDGRQNG